MVGNAHIHAVLDGVDFRVSIARHSGDAGPCEDVIRRMLAAYQDAGFTYLRDGGDLWGACMMARQLAPEYGIEYVAPWYPLYRQGNYGWFIGRGYADLSSYRLAVDEARDAGADFIKLMLTGIVDFNVYGRLTGFALKRSLVHDLIGYAHGKGLSVMAHINGARSVQTAVEEGVDSVEHGFFSDKESRACLAESHAIWVPTVSPVLNLIGTGVANDSVLRRVGAEQLEAVSQVAEAGGLIALGDDAGARAVPHVAGAQTELNYMREAIGKHADEVLANGMAALKARFPRRV